MVASYPYDDSENHIPEGFYSSSPDDDFFKYIALIYSKNHKYMHKGDDPCRDSEFFKDGITNGAHWYDVPGGNISCTVMLNEYGTLT